MLHIHAQFVYRPEYSLFDAPLIGANFLRNFTYAPLFEVLEDETHAFYLGKASKRGGEVALELVVLEVLLRILRVVLDLTVQRFEYAGPCFPQQVQGGVNRDAMDPGVES